MPAILTLWRLLNLWHQTDLGELTWAIILIHESNPCRYAGEARRKLCAQSCKAND